MKATSIGNNITISMLPADHFFSTSTETIITVHLVDEVIDPNIRALFYVDFTDKYYSSDNGETN